MGAKYLVKLKFNIIMSKKLKLRIGFKKLDSLRSRFESGEAHHGKLCDILFILWLPFRNLEVGDQKPGLKII